MCTHVWFVTANYWPDTGTTAYRGLSRGRFPSVAVSMWDRFTMYSGAVVV